MKRYLNQILVGNITKEVKIGFPNFGGKVYPRFFVDRLQSEYFDGYEMNGAPSDSKR